MGGCDDRARRASIRIRAAFGHPELTDEDRSFLAPIVEVLEVAAVQPHLDVVVVGAAA